MLNLLNYCLIIALLITIFIINWQNEKYEDNSEFVSLKYKKIPGIFPEDF